MARRAGLVAAGGAVLVVVAGAFVYAGSPGRIAEGVTIAGVDVGGLSPADAQVVLERRAAALAEEPLRATAGGRTYRLSATSLGLAIDWKGAAAEAQDRGDGFRPLRGFRRLATRILGSDVTPRATANPAAMRYLLARMGRDDRPHRDAAIRIAGLRPVVVRERSGNVVDRVAARALILGAFASLDRTPVVVPSRIDAPKVTADELEPALAKVQTAVSRPVVLKLGPTRYRLSRGSVGRLLELPARGEVAVRIGGPAADRYFKSLAAKVNRPARNASFVVATGGKVLIRPSVSSRTLDVPRTAEKLLVAALSPARRVAPIVVGREQPERTTADAKRMGVTGLVSSYTTIYGGDANRVHNVQLVARLIDGTLVAPGHVFSFNGTTGERNASKGFLEAPVIINGELQTGLGGGICQVSTTVFNAAFEAGLPITARTNHALYISHYPQGRDATVNYPDTDLKFVNDTKHWLLVRTFVGSSSLTVNLYGAPQHRRVESEVSPLVETGRAPTTWRKDPSLFKGQKVVESSGSPSRSTSVHRRVYDANGKLLYENTWYSSYRGEKKIVLVGTKPRPKPKEKKPAKPADGAPPTTPTQPGV
jgi:vancomycin resistance protein YoaR